MHVSSAWRFFFNLCLSLRSSASSSSSRLPFSFWQRNTPTVFFAHSVLTLIYVHTWRRGSLPVFFSDEQQRNVNVGSCVSAVGRHQMPFYSTPAAPRSALVEIKHTVRTNTHLTPAVWREGLCFISPTGHKTYALPPNDWHFMVGGINPHSQLQLSMSSCSAVDLRL